MEKQINKAITQARIDLVTGTAIFIVTIVFGIMFCHSTFNAASAASTKASTEAFTTKPTDKADDMVVTKSSKTQQAANVQVVSVVTVTDKALADEPMATEAPNEAIEEPQTAEEIDTTVTEEPTVTSPYADLLNDISSDDKEVLKRLIYHECRGNGGEAVAEVVLNRMQDSRFPDTLQEVVYAPGQFTPASFLFSASINEPGPFEECGRVVDEVLDPNYQRTIPANYVYFNSIGPGSSDYEWRGGNVFYAG